MAALMAAVSTVVPSPLAPKSRGSQKPAVGGGRRWRGRQRRRRWRRRRRRRRWRWSRSAWRLACRQASRIGTLLRGRGREQPAGQAVRVAAQLPRATAVASLAAGRAAAGGILYAFQLLVVRRALVVDTILRGTALARGEDKSGSDERQHRPCGPALRRLLHGAAAAAAAPAPPRERARARRGVRGDEGACWLGIPRS